MKKVALVTGASRGIGRSIAVKFLEEGYIVYGTYFESEDKINELVNKYGEDSFKKIGPYDFSDTADSFKLVEDIAGVEFDTLVLNAGTFSENDDFVNFDLDEFNKVMNCNFYSQLIIATKLQSFVKNDGNIVLMSSNDAYSGAFGSMSYSISKSAVVSLMKCLCVNYGRRHIRVNSISPGAINTDMNTPEQEFEAPIWTPIERIAQPYEVANVVYFLSSGDSSFINGENITIDGGYGNVSILLKDEIERERKIVGYEWLNERMASLKDGDKVFCLDTTPDYGWINHPLEEVYIDEHIKALERNVQVHRIIMTSEDKKESILNNSLIKKTLKESRKAKFIGVIKEEDVKKFNKSDFAKIGKGFEIFILKDGTKQLFIDSFINDDSMGYMIENEMMIEALLEVFENIYNNIKNKKIEVYKSNN